MTTSHFQFPHDISRKGFYFCLGSVWAKMRPDQWPPLWSRTTRPSWTKFVVMSSMWSKESRASQLFSHVFFFRCGQTMCLKMASFTGSNCKKIKRCPWVQNPRQGSRLTRATSQISSEDVQKPSHYLSGTWTVPNQKCRKYCTLTPFTSCTVASLANESFKLLETRSYLSLTNEKQRFVLPEPGMLEVQLLCCSTAWVASADMIDCQGVKSKGKKLLKMQNVTGPN